MIPFVDLKAQYLSIKDEIHTAITSVVNSCQFVLGPEVEAFEAEFAEYCQTRYAVGINSGTSALHLALLTGGLRPGRKPGLPQSFCKVVWRRRRIRTVF